MAFNKTSKKPAEQKTETELERVGYLTLDYVAKAGTNQPIFRGRVYMDDGTWVKAALWKADKEGTKLAYNGTLTTGEDNDRVGYINLMKGKEGSKAKMYGWIKEVDDAGEETQEYRIFLYQQIVNIGGKEVGTYNLEGSVNIEVGGDTLPVPVKSMVPELENPDDCPF